MASGSSLFARYFDAIGRDKSHGYNPIFQSAPSDIAGQFEGPDKSGHYNISINPRGVSGRLREEDVLGHEISHAGHFAENTSKFIYDDTHKPCSRCNVFEEYKAQKDQDTIDLQLGIPSTTTQRYFTLALDDNLDHRPQLIDMIGQIGNEPTQQGSR
jgi:hypothetical protein